MTDVQAKRAEGSHRASAIDASQLRMRTMGNAELALALLAELEWSAKEQATNLTLQAANHELPELIESTHAIKGAAALIGAEELARLAAQAEAAAHAGEVDAVATLVLHVVAEIERCLAQIPELRKQVG